MTPLVCISLLEGLSRKKGHQERGVLIYVLTGKRSYRYQVPPKILMGDQITGANNFTYFPGKSYGRGGPKQNSKKALPPVLVQRFNFQT